MENIKLNSVEEAAKLKAANCLPKGVRLMFVGQKLIFVKFVGKWMPVSGELQAKLEKKHLSNDSAGS
jgi:hypothetical protein